MIKRRIASKVWAIRNEELAYSLLQF